LPQIKKEREILIEQFNQIISLDINEIETSKKARELRLLIQKNRTQGINVWHKNAKDFFLKGGQFVDAIKRVEVQVNEKMESDLEQIEKHFENLEKQRILELHNSRIELIKPYLEDVSNLQLGTMESDVFEAYFQAKKQAHLDKIEAEQKAESERIAKEKAESEERERIRIENEKLKAEVEAREKQLAKERAESEAKLKAEAESRAKIEAELKAKKDAEIKAESERLEAELKAKKDAEKLAKAPIKKQLEAWVNSFELPKTDLNNEISFDIIDKFNSFKKWSLTEIESL